jgi:hypothetical protein
MIHGRGAGSRRGDFDTDGDLLTYQFTTSAPLPLRVSLAARD